MDITPSHYAILGFVVMAIGLFGVCSKRHPLAVLLCLSVSFVGPVIAFVGFAASGGGILPPLGNAVGLFLLVIMTAQVLLGVGIALVAWRHGNHADLDHLHEVQG
jgi:NADH:ubiquinone oxidoreductase subunit K